MSMQCSLEVRCPLLDRELGAFAAALPDHMLWRAPSGRSMAEPLDWPGLLRAGLLWLGLKPSEFWALTPAELALMLGQGGAPPVTRARLDELLSAYPDTRKETP